MTIQLLHGDTYVPLWRDVIAAEAPPEITATADQVLCRRLRLSMPDTLSAGNYLLDLASETESVNFATIVVKP